MAASGHGPQLLAPLPTPDAGVLGISPSEYRLKVNR